MGDSDGHRQPTGDDVSQPNPGDEQGGSGGMVQAVQHVRLGAARPFVIATVNIGGGGWRQKWAVLHGILEEIGCDVAVVVETHLRAGETARFGSDGSGERQGVASRRRQSTVQFNGVTPFVVLQSSAVWHSGGSGQRGGVAIVVRMRGSERCPNLQPLVASARVMDVDGGQCVASQSFWVQINLLPSVCSLPLFVCGMYLPPASWMSRDGDLCAEDDSCPLQQGHVVCPKIHVHAAMVEVKEMANRWSQQGFVVVLGDMNADCHVAAGTSPARRRFDDLLACWSGASSTQLRWMNGGWAHDREAAAITHPPQQQSHRGTTLDHIFVGCGEHEAAIMRCVLPPGVDGENGDGERIQQADGPVRVYDHYVMDELLDHNPVGIGLQFESRSDGGRADNGSVQSRGVAVPVAESQRVVRDTLVSGGRRVHLFPNKQAKLDVYVQHLAAHCIPDVDAADTRLAAEQALAADVGEWRAAGEAIGMPITLHHARVMQWRRLWYRWGLEAAAAAGMYDRRQPLEAQVRQHPSVLPLWNTVRTIMRRLSHIRRYVKQAQEGGLSDDVRVRVRLESEKQEGEVLVRLLREHRTQLRQVSKQEYERLRLQLQAEFMVARQEGDTRKQGDILRQVAQGGALQWSVDAATSAVEMGGPLRGTGAAAHRAREEAAVRVAVDYLERVHNPSEVDRARTMDVGHLRRCTAENADREAAVGRALLTETTPATAADPRIRVPAASAMRQELGEERDGELYRVEEVRAAISAIKRRASSTGMPADLLKEAVAQLAALERREGHAGVGVDVAQELLDNGLQTEWAMADPAPDVAVVRATPLYKKGDVADPSNYRFIGVASLVAKIHQYILTERLQRIIAPQLHPAQAGFLKQRSTVEHIITRDQLVHSQQRAGDPTYLGFLDVAKCFPSIDHELLLDRLWSMGVRGRLWMFVRRWMRRTTMYVQIGSAVSRRVRVQVGVMEGAVWSPLMCVVMLDPLLWGLHWMGCAIPMTGVPYTPTPLALQPVVRPAVPPITSQIPVHAQPYLQADDMLQTAWQVVHDEKVRVERKAEKAMLQVWRDWKQLGPRHGNDLGPRRAGAAARHSGVLVVCTGEAFADDFLIQASTVLGLRIGYGVCSVFTYRTGLRLNVGPADKTVCMVIPPLIRPTDDEVARMSHDRYVAQAEFYAYFCSRADAQANPGMAMDDDMGYTWMRRTGAVDMFGWPQVVSWAWRHTEDDDGPAEGDIVMRQTVPRVAQYRYLGVLVESGGPSYRSPLHSNSVLHTFWWRVHRLLTSDLRAYPLNFQSTVYMSMVREASLYASAAWALEGIPEGMVKAEAVVLRQLVGLQPVTVSIDLLRSATGIRSMQYAVSVLAVGQLITRLQSPLHYAARRMLAAEVSAYNRFTRSTRMPGTADDNVTMVMGDPRTMSDEMYSTWWSRVLVLCTRMEMALNFLKQGDTPAEVKVIRYPGNGIVNWVALVEGIALQAGDGRGGSHQDVDGSMGVHGGGGGSSTDMGAVVGDAPAGSMHTVKCFDGSVQQLGTDAVLARMRLHFRAALYAMEVWQRADTVLSSTAVVDTRRWAWHVIPHPYQRVVCPGNRLRTRLRIGLQMAITLAWYKRIPNEDRVKCPLCGLTDDAYRHQVERGDGNVQVQMGEKPRVLCVTHLVRDCPHLEQSRQLCWEAIRVKAVAAGVCSRSRVEERDRTAWFDLTMGAPVSNDFMRLGTGSWVKWYTDFVRDSGDQASGSAPQLHSTYKSLLATSAPFLKDVVEQFRVAIETKYGEPPDARQRGERSGNARRRQGG